MLRLSGTGTLKTQQIRNQRFRVDQVDVSQRLPFADAGAMYSWARTVEIPEYQTVEDFIREFNKTRPLYVALEGNKFIVEDQTGCIGEYPLGLYESEQYKYIALKNDAATDEFFVEQYVDVQHFQEDGFVSKPGFRDLECSNN